MVVSARILTFPSIGEMVMRQSPGSAGRWGDVQFHLDEIQNPDYVIVIDHLERDTVVECRVDNIWCVIHEPPVDMFKWLHDAAPQYGKVFTTDPDRTDPQYVRMHTSIPWELGKSYDFLKNCAVPEKVKDLSWVTSNKGFMEGHKLRLRFLDNVRHEIEFDLWGTGFEHIDDKWDGIAPYRYSMAIENYNGPFYWSEKLGDCFLGYAMPIYYGCTRIADFFPEESFIGIDITKPAEAIEIINDAIGSKRWERNFDAVVHARELVLDGYQFMPHFAKLIGANEALNGAGETAVVTLPAYDHLKRPALPIHMFN
ncbi:MAG: glycosyltransferase family 10, partial [Pseudomonadota bacterium]